MWLLKLNILVCILDSFLCPRQHVRSKHRLVRLQWPPQPQLQVGLHSTISLTLQNQKPLVFPGVGFFVPNIKHKETSGILSKFLKPRTSLVFSGVLSPQKNLCPKDSWTPQDTKETPRNTTVVSKTKNLYVPKTSEHHGNTTKHYDKKVIAITSQPLKANIDK
jgi:hypothetical protein